MPTNFRGGEDLQDAARSSPDLHYFTLVEELKSDNCYAVCYAVSSGWSTVKLVVAKVWSEAEKSLELGSRCFKRCYSNFLLSDFPDLYRFYRAAVWNRQSWINFESVASSGFGCSTFESFGSSTLSEHWHRRKWSNGLFGVPPWIFAFHPWLSSMPSSPSSKCYTIKPTNSQPSREHRRACDFWSP